ncbi:hypothetical protein HDV06_001904 [Boothiomyces sp. JEL0866]|nr:hypothetical protein HDV06_001904 [Boothiomyces sp. JEL0866]
MFSLLITAAAAQTGNNSTVSSICSSNLASVYCQIYTQACSVTQTNAICTKQFPAFLYLMCTNDFPTNAACKAIPTVVTNQIYVPSTKQVQTDISSLCKEMPSMTACKSCPDPTAASCDLMGTFSSICSQMPMTNCGDIVKLCSTSAGSSLSYCPAVLAANPSANNTTTGSTGASTTTGTSAPTSANNAGRTAFSGALLLLGLLI